MIEQDRQRLKSSATGHSLLNTPSRTRPTKVEQLAGDQTPELERVFRKMKSKKSTECKSEKKLEIQGEISKVKTLREKFERQNIIRKNSPRKTTLRDLNSSSCKKLKSKVNTNVRNHTPKKSSGVSGMHKGSQIKLSDIWEKICNSNIDEGSRQ